MFVKQAVFEALLRGTNLEKDENFLLQLKPYYDLKHPQRDYSPEAYNKVIDITCLYVFPNLKREEAMFEVGRAGFDGYRKTIVGRVGMAALSMLSTQRAVELSVKQTKGSYSGDISFEIEDSKRYRTRFRSIPGPGQVMLGAAARFWEVQGSNAKVWLIEKDCPEIYLFNYDIITDFS